MPVVPPILSADAPPGSTLPGLRGLSALANCQPKIVIDTREQAPLHFTRLPAIRGALYSGDYSVAGLEDNFAIERKSVDDLVACCLATQRERFEHELHRLRGYRFKRLLIVGSREDITAGRYYSRTNPKSVLATLGAFEARYDLPVIFAASPQEVAALIERWVFWFAREVVEATNNLLRGCTKQESSELPNNKQ
jgi:ERCC4-type nuclease